MQEVIAMYQHFVSAVIMQTLYTNINCNEINIYKQTRAGARWKQNNTIAVVIVILIYFLIFNLLKIKFFIFFYI